MRLAADSVAIWLLFVVILIPSACSGEKSKPPPATVPVLVAEVKTQMVPVALRQIGLNLNKLAEFRAGSRAGSRCPRTAGVLLPLYLSPGKRIFRRPERHFLLLLRLFLARPPDPHRAALP